VILFCALGQPLAAAESPVSMSAPPIHAEGNRELRYVWTDLDSDGQVDAHEQSQIT